MDKIERTLQGELHDTIARLRELGGAVTVEDPGGPVGAEEAAEGGGDAARIGAERELSWAVRSRLVGRANRVAEALDRLRHGTYGVFEICGNRIAPAHSGSCQKSRRAWPARGWKRGEPAAQEQNPAGRR